MEVLAAAGLDYIVIDREHGCFSAEETADYIRVAELGNTLPYVRIPAGSRTEVLHMLDIGARGLIVPNITAGKSSGGIWKISSSGQTRVLSQPDDCLWC